MEDAAVIVAIGAFLVAALGVIVAVHANNRADKANTLSATANGTSLAALEIQRQYSPPDWGHAVPSPESNQWYVIENTSGRDIMLLATGVLPEGEEGSLSFRLDPNTVVGYGDVVAFHVDKHINAAPDQALLVWRFVDDEDGTERRTARTFVPWMPQPTRK
jgi:hypothetical protein